MTDKTAAQLKSELLGKGAPVEQLNNQVDIPAIEAAADAPKPEDSTIKSEAPDLSNLEGATEQAAKVEEKAEEKEVNGVIDLVCDIPKSVWQNGIKPTYEFFKNGATQIWETMKSQYDAEVQHFEEVGAVRYGMGRLAGLGFKVIKFALITTVFVLLNNYLVTATGVSLFSPVTLAIVFAISGNSCKDS
jgi:hypothetical protein